MGIYRIELRRILADIDAGNVILLPGDVIMVADSTQVEQSEFKSYRLRVLLALDDSLAMESNETRRGGTVLRLSTLGTLRLIELRAEVAS